MDPGDVGADVEEPVRAELFSVGQLEQHARALAGRHSLAPANRSRVDGLLSRLAANERALRGAHAVVTAAALTGTRITPAAEWFLDNYHLIEEQIRTARLHLPRGYSRELPRLVGASGTPRVHDLALELISHAHGRVDIEGLRAFVVAYQEVRPLTLGELWAVPIVLRLALIDNLRRVAARITAGRHHRQKAAGWVERMLAVAAATPDRVVLVLAELIAARPGLTNAFAAEFASRLQGQGPALVFPVAWLEQRLAERGQTVERVFQLVTQSQAADQVAISNSISSLRSLGATDWRAFVETTSVVEQVLRGDPGGAYAGMDFATRDRYRHVVEALRKRCPLAEEEVAQVAVRLAREAHATAVEGDAHALRRGHVGYFLIDEGRPALERAVGLRRGVGGRVRGFMRRHPLSFYGGAVTLLTLASAAALTLASARVLAPWVLVAAAVLLAIACSQLALGVVHWAALLLVRPRVLARLDFAAGIPEAHRTAVVVPTMLTSLAEIDGLLEALEVRYLANRDEQLVFVLLTDFRDAAAGSLPGDAGLLARAAAGIQALEARYARAGQGVFFLLHRPRRWNPREGVWMGWERKRGKLEEFNAALRGRYDQFAAILGDVPQLKTVKYVIVLDSDTQLPRDAARQLAGTLAHPLNRPCHDEALGRVTRGHAILQPRVAITMESSGRSRFARLFAGETGIDPYTLAVSDVYQDLFAEGSFVGKGIYDVDAFQRALAGRLPENRVLSHDLLEGAYARAGLVSDITLFEDHPSAHAADVSRRTRWLRGDWQLLAWLKRRVPGGDGRPVRSPLSALSRWKLLDNLRRSLVAPALLGLLGLGWFTAGLAVPATLLVLATLVIPGLLAAGADLLRRPDELPRRQHLGEVTRTLTLRLQREAFALATLPYDAFLALTAIVRTLGRTWITKHKLLEWRTAADAQHGARTDLAGTYAAMWISPTIALGTLSGLVAVRPDTLLVAAPVLAAWAAAPALASWLSRPLHAEPPRLRDADRTFLRMVARRTWRFFTTFVTPEDSDLPPDNFQDDPPQGVAHRTSPTNIGLALTANLAAYDLGYLSVAGLIDRTTRTLAAMDRLQRHRGHFFNWYDTRTLEPLRPIYISTVDSGNLAGHLLTLATGLQELADHPLVRAELFTGLCDALDLLGERVRGSADTLAAVLRLRDLASPGAATLSGARDLLAQLTAGVAELTVESDPEALYWRECLAADCRNATDELAHAAPWTTLPPAPPPAELASLLDHLGHQSERPTLAEAARLAITLVPAIERTQSVQDPHGPAHAWLAGLRSAVVLAAERAAARLSELRLLAARCEEFAEYDVDLLYDRERRLLAIGYNVSEFRLDASHYDLLASEARLASFVAIAQGKLPQEHWFALGRRLTTTGGRPALVSWSGSMFEYLMPMLIMPSYAGTLLDETCRAVVARQIAYGRERGVAWGISESGYNKTDAQLNYQYRAFGVPGLGLKRGLADDLVVAPYASAMALMVDPEAATANLQRLAREGLLGDHGFFEAVDHTPARVPHGKDRVTVRSYMAHHQGMAFLALVHVLLGRPMQRRFAARPAFRATDLLLQERVARTPPVRLHDAEVAASASPAAAETVIRVFTSAATPAPEVHLLSNGSYHLAITNAGGGYSRWRDLAVTRWHEDPTRDAWGSFCYLRDTASGAFWSAAFQPTLAPAASYEAIFSQGRAEFRRRDVEIDTHVEISVSPEDDVELRRVSLTNSGPRARTIELTSYAEVVLATPAADAAHPAFSNLFVQTELVRASQAILCTRRPRSAGEKPPHMLHLVRVQGTTVGETSYETGRAEFIGRGRSPVDPAAMHQGALTDSAGAVLDPVVAIRTTVLLRPHETVRVHIVTGVADTRAGALALIEKYSDRHAADRVFELSWTHSQVLLRRLDVSEADTARYERLASHILYANPQLRAPRSVIARNKRGQSALWAHGISGDLPIALVRVADPGNLDLVRQLVKAHAFWRMRGLAADLVIWNEDPSGYREVLQEAILAVIDGLSETSLLDRPGGIFVRRSEQLAEDDRVLLQTVARLIVSDADGPLADQMNRRVYSELPPPLLETPALATAVVDVPAVRTDRPDLRAFNGLGGFTPDGREYIITTSRAARTPAPWVNVIANPWFGSVVSESGGAYTWCENAHGYRLTPWSNDPVGDCTGEAFYLRDEVDGRLWSPTPLPAGGAAPYATRHGFGYSIFEHAEDGIVSELRTFVAIDAPIKFIVVKLRNTSGRARRLSLTGYFELVLGATRPGNLLHVVTEVDPGSGGLLARNCYSSEFAARVAFLDCSEDARTVTGDRREFLGRNGASSRPAALQRARLSGRVGAGLDPCMAMQVGVDLADGQERELVFTFGSGRDVGDARTLIHRFRGVGPAQAALRNVWSHWNRILGAVHVDTPDASLDFLANGWLIYQVLSARMWGRSGFYQSGGAFGFRDQLQDAMALVHAEPTALREQIVRAASRQFREGDVQHWWHPPAGRGVRTHISDDYLWLPYVVCHYVAAIGDTGVLGEVVPFLEGRAVKLEEDSYYDLPNRSDEAATIYEHCVRAVRHGLRFGAHGLPLMGSGDWNDGMNLVGERGQGESVWLAFFLHDVLTRFAALARHRDDAAFADECTAAATQLRAAIEANGWDGEWYRRAYFDSGAPLGSAQNPECQIDSLPQSWAALSGVGDPARTRQALEAVDRRLVRRDLGLVQLFDPPFDESSLDPGYVKGYVPGVRENGGQYTHAAIWTAMAFAATGDSDRAWQLFRMLDPIRHGDSESAISTYKVEPYVIAADVYTNPQHAGRGGWTWYTGSAAWMYRLIVESLLGLHLEVDHLRVAPLVPPEWQEFTVRYRHRRSLHHIHVRRLGPGPAVSRVTCDGVVQPDHRIPLHDDGAEHHAEVELGG